ncbi:DUF2877 domain-containing protein [Corticicoccus populi]|uniref:DUF2877 domain-containing protein n=1 Tax=Corticicoccus populi TaxID=1812821 RepID=A0ABW5WW16_9STAP
MRIYADWVGITAVDRMTEDKYFIVHSIFDKGINISGADEKLIFIGTDINGLFPFGISVDPVNVQKMKAVINIGDRLMVEDSILRHPRFILDCSRAEIFTPDSDFYNADIKKLLDSIDDISFETYESSFFNMELISDVIKRLKLVQSVESDLRYIIGRGSGLTPTGDDILVGILYGHFINPFINESHIKAMKVLIEEPLTTTVSKNFLHCAADGIFSSRITDLHHHPSPESIEKLLTLGSSSGKDILYGIYMSLKVSHHSSEE